MNRLAELLLSWWPPEWVMHRRHRRFIEWLATRPDIQEKLDRQARDLAESYSLDLDSARDRITKGR